MNPSDAPPEEAIVRAWCAAEGLPESFDTQIDPRDEMLLFLRTIVPPRVGRDRLAYLRSGQEAFAVLDHALAAFGHTLARGRLLDFACGFGRMTRFLAQRVAPERLFASDIVPAAVEFVRGHFARNAFLSCSDPAELRWPGKFDAIYVGSLLSHLPPPRFDTWLRHLRGALTDDGLLIFSTHGLSLLPPERRDRSGFVFVPSSESLTLDTAEYGTAYVAVDRVRDGCARAGLPHVATRECDLWNVQDLFVASPQPLRNAQPWTRLPRLDGGLEGHASDARGGFQLHGWAAARGVEDPIDRVTLTMAGRLATEATLVGPTTEGDDANSRRTKCDWDLTGTTTAFPDGRSSLEVRVHTRAGATACVDVRLLELRAGRLELL